VGVLGELAEVAEVAEVVVVVAAGVGTEAVQCASRASCAHGVAQPSATRVPDYAKVITMAPGARAAAVK
jgi:hypothetical protein